jgi:squalene-hopene/tetraprenyl-beta-curcumene cyclase
VTARLLAELGSGSHWTGELSSSALSTATAVVALAAMDQTAHANLIHNGLSWLAAHANPDGGWGDTIRSKSNLSTTALVWAAFGAAEADADFGYQIAAAVRYIERAAGSLENLVPTIERRYGKDRTFSVPITLTLALSGRLGPDGWRRVRPLPFELAALPRGFYGALQLPVVSYALPALIAIGQAVHYHAPRFNPLRNWTRARTLNVLTTLQPPNGGFLEATPLTSFVTMSLASMGAGSHIVAQRGAEFLRRSVRPDGSWPIDTNLGTWVTTLAIKALGSRIDQIPQQQRAAIRNWLLGQQYQVIHPYTGAAPGAWAWTDLPGGVPDADDTAGALLALHQLKGADQSGEGDSFGMQTSVTAAINWLLAIQNRDGGIPTFCRGWGALPFDRSTPELTAHTLRAFVAWLPDLDAPLRVKVDRAIRRAIGFLVKSQRPDGSWIPLWFGHERASHDENPTYGTAQVLFGLNALAAAGIAFPTDIKTRAEHWLISAQHETGGWGGAPDVEPSIEETALALSALACAPSPESSPATTRAAEWLTAQWLANPNPAPSPIGLYFAKLWYYEGLYPLIFTADALHR